MDTECALPLLPLNSNLIFQPDTSAWRRRRVVRPNDLFSFAYSSLPMRMSVFSRRHTTAASTFRRGRSGSDMSRSTCSRICGKTLLNSSIRSNLVSSLTSRYLGWYRYCFRPLESLAVTWMWPLGSGQIHTSVHAGGIARALNLLLAARSLISSPLASIYEKPLLACSRRTPGMASVT